MASFPMTFNDPILVFKVTVGLLHKG